jgi:hypothetical protein
MSWNASTLGCSAADGESMRFIHYLLICNNNNILKSCYFNGSRLCYSTDHRQAAELPSHWFIAHKSCLTRGVSVRNFYVVLGVASTQLPGIFQRVVINYYNQPYNQPGTLNGNHSRNKSLVYLKKLGNHKWDNIRYLTGFSWKIMFLLKSSEKTRTIT